MTTNDRSAAFEISRRRDGFWASYIGVISLVPLNFSSMTQPISGQLSLKTATDF